jgi:class 3 adenylate cyclase
MSEPRGLPSGTVTFLFTDLEGSTPLHERLGSDSYRAILEVHHRLLCTAAEQGGGTKVSDTGDGFFFSFPTASGALTAAVAAQQALGAYPWPEGVLVRVRMGIHSGEASPALDGTLAGAYVNPHVSRTRRICDAGHGGQILLTQSTRELVFDRLPDDITLRDLGEYQLKGLKHPSRLFQVVLPEMVDQFPPLLAAAKGGAPSADGSSLMVDGSTKTGPSTINTTRFAGTRPSTLSRRSTQHPLPPLRVALLYKRRAQPDEELLKLLETHLQARGHSIFIDRHLTIGVEWAREIERQLREADAVVPLLSAASVGSEMLQQEVEVAAEAARENNGRPRLLPIRVRFPDPLPEPLAVWLGRWQHSSWEGAEDDERLVTELLRALEQPPELPAAAAGALEPIGGGVPLDSPFYVERPVDAQLRTVLAARRETIIRIRGARQMGKTSLLARGLQQAREAGLRVVTTDFQLLNSDQLQSIDSLLRTLAQWFADVLDLDVDPEADWKPARGPSMNFQRFLQRQVLGPEQPPLVWGLDEVDRLFDYPYASELFGMIRSWRNRRSLEPDGPWGRLTVAFAYAREAQAFITDPNQSPFNVGAALLLDDFLPAQVADLNERYGRPLQSTQELDRYYRLVGGQPFLVRRGLQEMVARGLDLAAVEAEADREDGIFGDHLKRLLVVLARDAVLEAAVRAMLRGAPPASRRSCSPDPNLFGRLNAAGIVAGDSEAPGARAARLRCELYATYLGRHLG